MNHIFIEWVAVFSAVIIAMLLPFVYMAFKTTNKESIKPKAAPTPIDLKMKKVNLILIIIVGVSIFAFSLCYLSNSFPEFKEKTHRVDIAYSGDLHNLIKQLQYAPIVSRIFYERESGKVSFKFSLHERVNYFVRKDIGDLDKLCLFSVDIGELNKEEGTASLFVDSEEKEKEFGNFAPACVNAMLEAVIDSSYYYNK